MRHTLVAFALVASLSVVGPVAAQQPETGPATTTKDHPVKGPETGTRGPSGGSPETGYHGPRDVTTDAEPGKPKSPEELRKTGRSPEEPKSKTN